MQEIIKTQNLHTLSYFLSNEKCFFHRYCDTGFKTKWTGFWCEELKFLEYFAFYSQGVWLSPETCKKIRYNGVIAEHTYEIGKEVKEKIFIPKNTRSLIILLRGVPECEMEMAVNIRKRIENVTQRKYKLSFLKNTLLVKNPLGSLGLKVQKGKIDFQKNEIYKTHYPGGKEQICFIPGKISLKGDPLKIEIFVKAPTKNSHIPEPPKPPTALNSDNKILKKTFYWCITGMELLRKKYNCIEGFYAGLPWFQHLWSRDSLWIVPSLLCSGYIKDAKTILSFFAKHLSNGRLPDFISCSESSGFSIDTSPLWIIGLERYVRESGDLKFLKNIKLKVIEVLEFLFSRTNSLGFLTHDIDSPETWMDTLKREENAVDVQGIYYGCLKASENLLDWIGEEDIRKKVIKTKKMLETNFENFYIQGYYADRIYKGKPIHLKTSNVLVPLLFGLPKHRERIMEIIENEFTWEKGVSTMGKHEIGFSPYGYHTGSVWSLTTAWACACEFLTDMPEHAWKYFKKLANDLETDSLGCIGECWDAVSSKLLGCGLQLWGSGFIPSLIDDYMLGIEIDSIQRKIRISPKLPKEIQWIKRERIVQGKPIKIIVKRNKNRVEIRCKSPFILIKD